MFWSVDTELSFLLSSVFKKSFKSPIIMGCYESTNWSTSYARKNEGTVPNCHLEKDQLIINNYWLIMKYETNLKFSGCDC